MFICQHKLCIFTKLHTNGVYMYGKKLKIIRNSLSQTQEKMAEILGLSGRTYSAYERDENNPPYSMLVTLCTKYNVNLNWFIADKGEMFNAQYNAEKNNLRSEVLKILKDEGVI